MMKVLYRMVAAVFLLVLVSGCGQSLTAQYKQLLGRWISDVASNVSENQALVDSLQSDTRVKYLRSFGHMRWEIRDMRLTSHDPRNGHTEVSRMRLVPYQGGLILELQSNVLARMKVWHPEDEDGFCVKVLSVGDIQVQGSLLSESYVRTEE